MTDIDSLTYESLHRILQNLSLNWFYSPKHIVPISCLDRERGPKKCQDL